MVHNLTVPPLIVYSRPDKRKTRDSISKQTNTKIPKIPKIRVKKNPEALETDPKSDPLSALQ